MNIINKRAKLLFGHINMLRRVYSKHYNEKQIKEYLNGFRVIDFYKHYDSFMEEKGNV